LTEGEKE